MLVALRSLRKNPGLTASVILLLGFGIGANTALFSVVHAVLFAGIPGAQRSEELVRLRRTQNGRAQGNASYPDYVSYRDRSTTLAGMAAERLIQMRLSGPPAQILPCADRHRQLFPADRCTGPPGTPADAGRRSGARRSRSGRHQREPVAPAVRRRSGHSGQIAQFERLSLYGDRRGRGLRGRGVRRSDRSVDPDDDGAAGHAAQSRITVFSRSVAPAG